MSFSFRYARFSPAFILFVVKSKSWTRLDELSTRDPNESEREEKSTKLSGRQDLLRAAREFCAFVDSSPSG